MLFFNASVSSYSYLVRQRKAPLSSSFIKTFEYVIVNQVHQFSQDELGSSLVALIKLQKVSSKMKLINNQTLLEIFDRFNYELEDIEKPIKMSTLSEVYYHVLSHEVLSKEIEARQMELKFALDGIQAKELFNFISVCTNREFLEGVLVPETRKIIQTMIPEEIVILNSLIARHSVQDKLSDAVQSYLEMNKDEMETQELTKVYMSCLKNNILLPEGFRKDIEWNVLSVKLPKSNAQSLP